MANLFPYSLRIINVYTNRKETSPVETQRCFTVKERLKLGCSVDKLLFKFKIQTVPQRLFQDEDRNYFQRCRHQPIFFVEITSKKIKT